MLKKLIAKLCAFCGCSFLLGKLMHDDYEMWHNRGRELYLASKVTFFEKHMATVQPIAITIFVMAILFGFCIVLYEVLQLALLKLLTLGNRSKV